MSDEAALLALAVEGGDPGPIIARLARSEWLMLPPDGFAAALPVLRSMALATSVMPLVHGRDVPRGLLLAQALLIVARRARDRAPDDPILAENLGQAADLVATALERSGRAQEVVELAQTIPPEIIDQTNGYQAVSLSARGVDALIVLGRLDDADALLGVARGYDDLLLTRSGRRDPNLPFVAERLAKAFGRIADPVDLRTTDTKAVDDYGAALRSVAEGLGRLEADDALVQATRALEVQAATEAKPDDARDVVDRLSASYQRLAAMMGLDDALSRHNITVQQSGSLLLDPEAGRDPEQLRSMRVRLVEAQAWYAGAGHELEAIDAPWPIAVISRRLGEHAVALEAMGRIRDAIERRRLGISDPQRTAALFGRFPWLYENIVLSALELSRLQDALSAMEASKGRAIAELRAARDTTMEAEGLAQETLAAGRAAARISALTAALGIDYLSVFVGADETIGMLVTPTGAHHVARIPISKERLRTLLRQVDPGGWSGFGATRVDRALAPLVEWVLPHLSASILVISPDDPLHNLPFQYLATPGGGRLIDRVATVKVHGADDLRAMAETSASRPEMARLAFLPARDEGGSVSQRQAGFEQLVSRFPIRAAVIDGARFDTAAAARLSISREVLHLAAHGHWPHPKRGARPEDMPNPYDASGVLLASNGRLPERGEPRQEELLSPRLVMESPDIKVEGAIVGLQACVSGLSQEGRAGDALGLEWALLARGASTVIASHWDVSFTVAVAFFERFYALWLGHGYTRVEAYRTAMREIRDDPRFADYGLEWAAFTVIGDWR